MCCICPSGFQIPDYKYKINNSKPLSFLFFPSSSISLSSILSPFRLHSVFLLVPLFPLSLSFRYIHSTCAQLSLSLLTSHSAPSFLSFHISPIIFLLHSLSLRYSGISSVIHLSYSLLYLDSLILLLLSCLSVSLSFSLSSTSIHPPFALNLFTFSLTYLFSLSFFSFFFFFCLHHSISILHSSFPSLTPNFAALFPTFSLSLFLLYPSLPM
jgi:hypothetical protein